MCWPSGDKGWIGCDLRSCQPVTQHQIGGATTPMGGGKGILQGGRWFYPTVRHLNRHTAVYTVLFRLQLYDSTRTAVVLSVLYRIQLLRLLTRDWISDCTCTAVQATVQL